MKLIYKVTLRLTMVLLPVIALWSVIFYFAMVEEINDEADDSLADYAETIIRRQLAGYPLPQPNSGSNNSYTIVPLEGEVEPYSTYYDQMVYIPEEQDTEPARVLTTIFSDADGRFYELKVAMPTFERDDLRDSIFWHVIALSIVLVLTILASSLLIFQRSMRPLFTLLSWFDAYVPGKKVRDIPNSDVTEFNKLNKSAHTAVCRGEEYFHKQKQFIGNASHELQTPLAVIGNRVEWLIDSTKLTDEQYGELIKVQHTLRRLVRLNRTLLLLSRIDNGQFPDSVDVDLVSVVNAELEVYCEIYPHRAANVTVAMPEKSIVRMNESLAGALITNLLKNAFCHSDEDAAINIVLSERMLRIENDGAAALDSSRIFDRFYNDGKSGSTGLGLAIVSSICRYYGFEVNYVFENGKHVFTVKM